MTARGFTRSRAERGKQKGRPGTAAANSVVTCGGSEADAPKYDCAGIPSLSVSGMFVDEPHSHNRAKRTGKLSAHRQSAGEGLAGRTGKAAGRQEEGVSLLVTGQLAAAVLGGPLLMPLLLERCGELGPRAGGDTQRHSGVFGGVADQNRVVPGNLYAVLATIAAVARLAPRSAHGLLGRTTYRTPAAATSRGSRARLGY